MKIISAVFLFLIVVSCAQVREVTKPTNPKYAPEGYEPVGVVRYLNSGPSSLVEERREKAFKVMYENCKGKYKVIGESDRESGNYTTTYNQMTNTLNTSRGGNRRYIKYKCVTSM